jgi:hypothetical protein
MRPGDIKSPSHLGGRSFDIFGTLLCAFCAPVCVLCVRRSGFAAQP